MSGNDEANVVPNCKKDVAPIPQVRVKVRKRSAVPVPHRYRNRPAALRGYLYRAWESSVGLGLSRGTLAVLQAVIATGISVLSPFSPVFAKKSTLARLAGVGEATVYRALRDLEHQGLIVRQEQIRLEDGILDLSMMVITDKLAGIIGIAEVDSGQEDDRDGTCFGCEVLHAEEPMQLPVGPQESVNQFTECSSENAFVGHQLIDGLIDGTIYKERNIEPKASVNYQSAQGKFVQIEGRSVAQELVWLITENRLTFGALFQLQTLAKQVPGQQLSDYINYRSERIKQLPAASDCYRYLKRLIANGLDARYLCSQRAKREKLAERKQQRSKSVETLNTWCKARDGMTMINPVTRVTFKINANHGLLEVGENGQPIRKPNLKITGKFIRSVNEGTLVLFDKPETARDIEHGNRRLAEISAKHPWLRRRNVISPTT